MSITFSSTTPSTHGITAITQQMAEGGATLPNHPTQSATTIDGWSAVLFGIHFSLAGVFVIAAAFDAFPVHGRHAPTWLIAMVGGFFFLAGEFLTGHGVRGLIRKAKYKRESLNHPDEPWCADYHWNREGFTFSAFKAMLGRLVGALLWTTFLVPFFWIGVTQRGTLIFAIFAGIFMLFGLYFWLRWARMLAELVRYGNSFLTFDQFPFFTGGRLNARLRVPRHVPDLDELTLTLRCVQENYVVSGNGENRSSSVVCYELYKDRTTLTRDQIAALAGGDIPMQFSIPADKPVNNLIATPPLYWEIEARGNSSKVNYEAYFLVPVYKPV